MEEIKIIPLGIVSPFCTSENNCPGYLIKYKEHNILLDCGNGITKYLNLPNDLNNLHIIITHYHIDHFGDLGTLQYASFCFNNLGMLKNKINIYLPKTEYNFNKKSIVERKESFSRYLDIENDKTIFVDDLKITFKDNKSHTIESFMIKLENKDFKIIYTSDIGTTNFNELVNFSLNADLLICESSFLLKHNANSTTHFTAYKAGILAKESNSKKLVLTHLWPLENKNEYLDEALTVFKDTIIPTEGKTLILKK